MRIVFLLSLVALIVSVPLAWFHHEGRSGDADASSFAIADPRARAEQGAKERWLGVELSGWEQAVREDPDDADALIHKIGSVVHLGSVAVDQPTISSLLKDHTDAYIANRARIDPDGRHLQAMLNDWIEQRLEFPYATLKGFYVRAAASMFLAARGDPRGHAALKKIVSAGEFWTTFFPYVSRHHPNWSGVEPIVRHYLETGSLAARVGAGVTLLDYHLRYGAGEGLYDRHLEDIRAAFKEVKTALRAGRLDPETVEAGNQAFIGMAMLANAGFEEERKILQTMRLQFYPYHADRLKMARVWADLAPFTRYSPRGKVFAAFSEDIQIAYYDAAAHRLAAIRRQPAEKRLMKEAERALCLELFANGFDGQSGPIRLKSLRALVQFDETLGRDVLRRAIAERGTISVYAGILAENVDRVPILVPALRSTEADLPAIAVTGLLAIDGPQALQK